MNLASIQNTYTERVAPKFLIAHYFHRFEKKLTPLLIPWIADLTLPILPVLERITELFYYPKETAVTFSKSKAVYIMQPTRIHK